MQLSAFFLLALGLQVSAATYSQTVSFTGKDVPLKTVFASVKKQTGYGVFFENGEAMLQSSAPVTLDLKNVSLEVFLKVCLKDQPLEYALEGKTIFIKKKEAVAVAPVAPSGDSILQIKGRVTNDKGEPLVNANITVKRTGRGTITDANGNFYLRNVSSADVVMVSFIGYKMQYVPLKDRVNLMVVLEATKNELDKVVVQAYGTTSQRLATGNIGVVRSEDIAKQPVMNVLQAVQGQVAGAVITSRSGYASGTVKVEIRGRNTISQNFSSDPLYIIDGVPLTILDLQNADSYTNGSAGVIQSGITSPAIGQSPFFNINPMDIESIEVLKDADATAIYGSRAANGVILITTKKGKAGKTKLDVNVYTGISQITKYYHLLNTQQYVSMRKEALANDGEPVDINYAPDLVAWDTIRYTDWQKYLWGNSLGRQTDAQASLSGGDARTTFRVAAGYNYQTEILTANGSNQRGSLSFNINHKSLNQRFNMSLSGAYTITSSDMIFSPSNIVTLPPNAPAIWDNKGKLNYTGWQPLNYDFFFGSLLQPYTTKTNFLNSNLVLSYEILKGLTLRSNLGYSNIQNNQTFLTPIASQDPTYNPTGSSQFGYSFVNNLIVEPQLEYNGFINKGKLNILAGASSQMNSTSSINLTGLGYTNDLLLSSASNAPIKFSGNSLGKYKYAAAFGRINYDWENKYIININVRRDGSTKFGPGRQFGTFGSLGAAWIFTEENWMKKGLPFLSFGKLRGSYGTTGGDQIGGFGYISLWSFSQLQYNNTLPLNPIGHSDSLLHWQVNKKMEIALDLGLFKDRVTLSASWYRNRCDNQLVQFPTPFLTGFSRVTSNSPANVENKGWEFLLSAKIVDDKKISWLTKFNIGLNRNKLLAYPNFSQSPYAGSLIIGKSLNIKRILHFTGVDPQTGLYSFQDLNKDGQVTVDQSGKTIDDRYPVDLSPKFDGGFTNTINYKNWQLSIFVYFKKQIGQNALAAVNAAGDQTNQPIEVLNRWQKPGDITNIAKFTTMPNDASFQNYRQFSDAVYTDASFIRLQNLSLSYSLPGNLLKKAGIGSCRVYLQGENLFTITSYKGIDPEVQVFGGVPRARIMTAGITCNL